MIRGGGHIRSSGNLLRHAVEQPLRIGACEATETAVAIELDEKVDDIVVSKVERQLHRAVLAKRECVARATAQLGRLEQAESDEIAEAVVLIPPAKRPQIRRAAHDQQAGHIGRMLQFSGR